MTAFAAALAGLAGLVATATLVGTPVFSFVDDDIDESSGLVDFGTTMVTTNDSGDDAVLYVIDEDGRTIGRTTYADEVTDVEALAPAGPDEVWVGDIGDNRERRSSVQVYRVPVAPGDRTVRAPAYDLVYPDGPRNAESLVLGPDGRLRIITKGLLGGSVYIAPKDLDPDGPNLLRLGPTVNLFATDAALFPDGRHVLVRGYGSALIARFPSFAPVAYVDLPFQEQGEGVSIGTSGRIRLSSEGANSAVLQIGLPAQVLELMETSQDAESAPAEPLDLTEQSWIDDIEPWMVGAAAAALALGVLVLRRRR